MKPSEVKERHALICALYGNRCQMGNCPEPGFSLVPVRYTPGKPWHEFEDHELKPFCREHAKTMRKANWDAHIGNYFAELYPPGRGNDRSHDRGNNATKLQILLLRDKRAANDDLWRKRKNAS